MAQMGTAYHCCVPMCTNDSRYDTAKTLTFVKFPVDKAERKTWVVKIRRDVGKNFQITDATRICSAHFLETDFDRKLSGVRRRKPGVIPSIFAWTSETPKRVNPRKRCQKNSASESIAFGEDIPSSSASTSEEQTPSASADHDYSSAPTSDKDKLAAALLEIERFQQKVAELETNNFALSRFSNDPKLISFYTGFKDYDTLKYVFLSLQPTATTMIRWTQMQRNRCDPAKMKIDSFKDETLSLIDQFFLFLCRVRQGLHEQDLAVRFNVSQSCVSRVLITWSNYLYVMLGSLLIWPSRAKIDEAMPESFKKTYPLTRVILDCTEVKVQTPTSKVLNSETYSNYKRHTTFKSLVGITPCGMISFVSSLYTGSISDQEITSRSGILDLLEPGDEVMADKGFVIQKLLDTKQAKLVIPPFLGPRGKFSEDEVMLTHEIARLRIHVERAIRRIKEYQIFDGIIPLNLAPSISQIWTVCSVLTIFRGPLF